MIYQPSTAAIVVFALFVAITLGLSFFLGRKARSSEGYFAAHGQIPWFVNGVAFAGDYLSAASFLGICGMIAFHGYDGFLYSIGFLAGWIVALFVIAEPMKRLGKFTFADALNSRFQSKGIKLAAGISTLVVSIFYLIPQMVGAGALVRPLLGLEHWMGVVLVGTVVILIVVTAGMVSTTWVQFLKGSLLVVFSTVLTVMILNKGLTTTPGSEDFHPFRSAGPMPRDAIGVAGNPLPGLSEETIEAPVGAWRDRPFVTTRHTQTEQVTIWKIESHAEDQVVLREAQTLTTRSDGTQLVNGELKGTKKGEAELHSVGNVSQLPQGQTATGPLGPISYFSTLQESEVALWRNEAIPNDDGSTTVVYYPQITPGAKVLRPGENPKFAGIRSERFTDKLNFLSLMLALFCGTASLPHILIRYYTVKDAPAARKSTIVGIASIGFFYVLTLYIGLGAMTSGALDVTDSNMAAPLLARSLSETLFAIISAIAFTTVLGTVSGLILASAGAIAHDLVAQLSNARFTEHQEVRIAKLSSIVVGMIAIVLGIWFQKLNVGYLVGWAFSIAASANLPALVMTLFWKRVTRQGIIAAVVVGMVSSLGWILASADAYKNVYGWVDAQPLVPFSEPGIVTIPLGFVVIVVVSLLTRPERAALQS